MEYLCSGRIFLLIKLEFLSIYISDGSFEIHMKSKAALRSNFKKKSPVIIFCESFECFIIANLAKLEQLMRVMFRAIKA